MATTAALTLIMAAVVTMEVVMAAVVYDVGECGVGLVALVYDVPSGGRVCVCVGWYVVEGLNH